MAKCKSFKAKLKPRNYYKTMAQTTELRIKGSTNPQKLFSMAAELVGYSGSGLALKDEVSGNCTLYSPRGIGAIAMLNLRYNPRGFIVRDDWFDEELEENSPLTDECNAILYLKSDHGDNEGSHDRVINGLIEYLQDCDWYSENSNQGTWHHKNAPYGTI